VYQHPSQLLPLTPIALLLFPSPGHGMIYHNYHYGCNGSYQYGHITTIVCSKKALSFYYFLVLDDCCGNTMGQNLRFWMTDVIKQECEEWHIIKLHTVYIGDFSGPNEVNDTCGGEKMHTGTMDRDLTVFLINKEELFSSSIVWLLFKMFPYLRQRNLAHTTNLILRQCKRITNSSTNIQTGVSPCQQKICK
jgi:hypothetical protein